MATTSIIIGLTASMILTSVIGIIVFNLVKSIVSVVR